MKCDTKLMIKIGVGIAAVLGIAYFTLPGARALVVASAPILLSLICPLAMIFMMKGMNSGNKQQDEKSEKPAALPPAGNLESSNRR